MRGTLVPWLAAVVGAMVLYSRETPGFPGRGQGSANGVLLAEISPLEGALQVAQVWLPGSEAAQVPFPLLVPEEGVAPEMRPAGMEDGTGIQVRGRGGARGVFRDGRLFVSGRPDGSGEFGLEVSYRIPVQDSRLLLRTEVAAPLARVQVIHRGGPHALHVRPLHPYAFREEDEGDGPWRYQDLLGTLGDGETLRIAVGRLPEARRPYRLAGTALLWGVGALALYWGLRRRD